MVTRDANEIKSFLINRAKICQINDTTRKKNHPHNYYNYCIFIQIVINCTRLRLLKATASRTNNGRRRRESAATGTDRCCGVERKLPTAKLRRRLEFPATTRRRRRRRLEIRRRPPYTNRRGRRRSERGCVYATTAETKAGAAAESPAVGIANCRKLRGRAEEEVAEARLRRPFWV